MAPSAGTDPRHLPRLRGDVVDDVVGPARVTADPRRNMVKAQREASPPRDVVIRARRVPADAKATNEPSAFVKSQAATKHIHAADAPIHHRIVRLTIGRGVA